MWRAVTAALDASSSQRRTRPDHLARRWRRSSLPGFATARSILCLCVRPVRKPPALWWRCIHRLDQGRITRLAIPSRQRGRQLRSRVASLSVGQVPRVCDAAGRAHHGQSMGSAGHRAWCRSKPVPCVCRGIACTRCGWHARVLRCACAATQHLVPVGHVPLTAYQCLRARRWNSSTPSVKE